MKSFSFQDRHENNDAYDLVFTLLNHKDGPRAAGAAAACSPVAAHEQVVEALALLAERFADAGQDGESAYALFLADPEDEDERARLCRRRPALPCRRDASAVCPRSS